uniref:Uncharacterized protein n=1 Tax=Panagrolaimus sp. PS1159 TaxID=55785 RepID=A0AC35GNF9_9BILA
MEIDEKHRLNCFQRGLNFQLPCLCYDDNLPPVDIDNRFDFQKNDVIYYCGTQQSMICFDVKRKVVSSNPTINMTYGWVVISDQEFEIKSNSEPFYSNIGNFIGNSRPVKFTFTIYNNNSAYVSTSDGKNPKPFKVKGFNFTEGYIDQDSTKYKMITVLPFQIFNPTCQVKWTFYGKSVQHLNPTVEFHATHDAKEYFVADKRTRFSKVKIDNKPKNATIN